MLCKEFEPCIGDAIYAYTEEVLGDIQQITENRSKESPKETPKETPKDMPKDVAAPTKERKEKKKTGKDEQLASNEISNDPGL